MKKQNKQKGFTLVELVIVIAVIAILAGVLIPTFSGIVEKANKSARLQEAESALKIVLIAQSDGDLDDAEFYVSDGSEWHKFTYTNGKLEDANATTTSVETSDNNKTVVENGTNNIAYKEKSGEESSDTLAKLKDLSTKIKIIMTKNDAKQIN